MKPIKIKIKDIEWSFAVLGDQEYVRKHGADSQGITDKDDKLVHFKESRLSLALVKHELLHVYFSSCCIDSATELQAEDAEEIAAEIIAHHGEDLLKISKKLYNSLKEIELDE